MFLLGLFTFIYEIYIQLQIMLLVGAILIVRNSVTTIINKTYLNLII
jgi:hypothetical protein